MFIMAVKEPKVVSLDNHLRFWAIISMFIVAVKEPKVICLDNYLVMCIMAVQMSQGPMWCLTGIIFVVYLIENFLLCVSYRKS